MGIITLLILLFQKIVSRLLYVCTKNVIEEKKSCSKKICLKNHSVIHLELLATYAILPNFLYTFLSALIITGNKFESNNTRFHTSLYAEIGAFKNVGVQDRVLKLCSVGLPWLDEFFLNAVETWLFDKIEDAFKLRCLKCIA